MDLGSNPNQTPEVNQGFVYEDPDLDAKVRRKLIRTIVLASLAALVIIGGGISFWIYYNQTVGRLERQITTLTSTLAATPSAEDVLPVGLVHYENTELGFSFNYPEEWGAVSVLNTEAIGIGSNYFYATFDNLNRANGPRGGGNTIAFGAPSANAVFPERGLIHTDYAGYIQRGNDYIYVRSVFDDNKTANITILNRGSTRRIETANTTGVLIEESGNEYYGYSYIEAKINLPNDEYNGITFVTSDSGLRSDFIKMIESFKILY